MTSQFHSAGYFEAELTGPFLADEAVETVEAGCVGHAFFGCSGTASDAVEGVKCFLRGTVVDVVDAFRYHQKDIGESYDGEVD